MIYLDNAATTRTKPPQVIEAITAAMSDFGGVGRGAHGASLDAGMAVYNVRRQLAELFNAPSPSRVAFTCNVTEALNMVVAGLLGAGDHAVTTAASHNSVLRPLYRAVDTKGSGLSIVPIGPDGSLDYDGFDRAFESNTRLAVVTHASNLTGDVYDVERMACIAHSHGALLVLDTAQTAGLLPLDMARQGIDLLCFTGHKGLYGPQGTGGLCVAEGVEVPPFKEGGTGIHSYDRRQPTRMPESLEAGTLNAHGIAGLGAGVAYLQARGIDTVYAETRALTERFAAGVRAIPGVTIYGGGASQTHCGIVALNIDGVDAGAVADALSTEYDIATRAGAHCAPLMHEALGTQDRGSVRFSFSHFNTFDEVDTAISAVAALASEV